MADKVQEQISQISVNDDSDILNETSNRQRSYKYRADIDGMRAIAVSIVVLFHAWPNQISGGFIGVDVFFVISGYLITQIIIKQNTQKQFSYLKFYNRRIKRILPALFPVLLFVLIIGITKVSLWLIKTLVKTCIASSFFIANIQLLFSKISYFNPWAKFNPLLHLWSLGVEQQFYIFWPFLITLLINKFPYHKSSLIVLFTFLSYQLNVYFSYENPKFDFYFPFCRFWQMALGGLLAMKKLEIKNKITLNLLSIIGSLMIILPAFWLTQKVAYPGWWVVFPTLGSIFIIKAGDQSFVNKWILSLKGMVFVGKISYSLYLWHWPLLTLFRAMYPIGSDSIFAKTFVIVLLSILCSIGSYFLIENPIRYSKKKYISIILLIIMFCISLSSILILINSESIFKSRLNGQILKQIQKDMIPSEQDYFIENGRKHPNSSKNKIRSPGNATKIRFYYNYHELNYKKRLLDKKIDISSKFYKAEFPKNDAQHYEVINQGQQNLVLFVGDSYGNVGARFQKLYEDAIRQNKTEKFPTVVCIISPGVNLLPQYYIYNFTMNWIKQFKPKRVLLINKFDYYYDDPQFHKTVSHYASIVKQIVQQNISVAISTLRPRSPQYDPALMVDNNGIIKRNVQPQNFTFWKDFFKNTIQHFKKNMQKAGAEIIDYTKNQCWEEVCEVLSPKGSNLFSDGSHYTIQYSRNWMSAADHIVQF